MSAADGRATWQLRGPKEAAFGLDHRPVYTANDMLTLRFAVHAYDPKEMAYYKAFHTGDADVKGYVKTRPAGSSGSPFEMKFDTQPAPEPQSPVVIPFSMTVVPASEEFDLHVATANLQVRVDTWGVAAS